MNVRELIEALNQYDPETMIVVNGYEGGYAEVKELKEINIELDVHTEWYYGPHDEADNKESDCKAILFKRN